MLLAEAALSLLAGKGNRADGGEHPKDSRWRFTTEMSDGLVLGIHCSGPDLPARVPARTILPADIANDPKWVGTYRLGVAAPLTAFDISWRVDEPLRIMYFSRGDWERELLSIAGHN